MKKNVFFDLKSRTFLRDLLLTNSPSGYERDAICATRKYCESFSNCETDVMGNLFCHVGSKNGLKIVITAHSDEVGFQITEIAKDGFCYLRNVGRLDRHTLPGSSVVVLTQKGPIRGVLGKKAPHIQSENERNSLLDLEMLCLDVGASSDLELKDVISIGDFVVCEPNFRNCYNGRRFISKGCDNKVGVFVLAETLRRLSVVTPLASVFGVVTTQEEIGCRGSIVCGQRLLPDIAFVVDVGIDTDLPTIQTHGVGRLSLGKGPGICINADNNIKLIEMLKNIGVADDIPFQSTIGFLATGGTETSRLQLMGNGTATALISIPNRYMHSAVEMCEYSDLENAIILLVKTITMLSQNRKIDFRPW